MGHKPKQKILNRKISYGTETPKEIFNILREVQIKMTLRFHLTPVTLVKIRNTNDSFC